MVPDNLPVIISNLITVLIGIVPPLSWSSKLAQSAQNWANTMASQCQMYHSGTSGVGENVAEGNPSKKIFYNGISRLLSSSSSLYTGQGSIGEVLTDWADNEKPNYDAATQTCNGVCGHYTQVMWKTTTLVGCGVAHCASNNTPYYCCQYIRPGNCNGYNFMSDDSPCSLFTDASFTP